MPNPIVHWELNTQDPAAAVEYYKSLFGWTVQPVSEMGYNLVQTESGRGADGGIQGVEEAPKGVTIYVEVDDPQSYLDKAVALGGAVVMPVTVIPGMVTMAQFSDPQGNVVGVVASETPA
jgi:uncharacterized protein